MFPQPETVKCMHLSQELKPEIIFWNLYFNFIKIYFNLFSLFLFRFWWYHSLFNIKLLKQSFLWNCDRNNIFKKQSPRGVLSKRCSVNLQHIFRTPFTKDISGRLLLIFATIEPLRFSFTLWIYTNIKNIEHQEWFKYAFWFRWGYRLPLTNFHPFDFCRTSTKLSFASANVFSGKNSQCYFHMQQDLK